MTTEKIKRDIIKLMTKTFKDKGFNIDTIEYVDLFDNLTMDSITFISIIVEIELHFNIEIPSDLLTYDNFSNVDDFVSIVKNTLEKQLAE